MDSTISTIQVIQPAGILDGPQANQLRHDINESLQAGARGVLVDLQNITFIDSSGLGGLVMAFKSARATGRKLFFCSVGEQARMLFEITGMDQVFQIYPDQKEFDRVLQETPELI